MHPCYCGASQGHVMGTCTCTMLYDYDYAHAPYDDVYSSFTPSPSSVDCTLSLGTPSTRLTQEDRRSSVSNFCWDLLQSKHTSHNSSKSTRPSNASSHNDPLLARRCANCDTTSTPLWRNGPRGPKSLCNACGIRFKKEERRASAAAASATSAAVPGGVMESAHAYGQHSNTWYAQSQSQKMGNEYRFMEDSDRESENGIPFLSWKLNVADRTSLIHDFTR